MVQVVNLCEVRAALETASAIRNTRFWDVVDNHIRADFFSKRNWLNSIGNRTVEVREARADASCGGDYIMILFGGTGPLQGHSFAFAVRHQPADDAVRAEIWVTDTVTTTTMSKELGVVQLQHYSNAWLSDCYAAAMNLLAPVPSAGNQVMDATRW